MWGAGAWRAGVDWGRKDIRDVKDIKEIQERKGRANDVERASEVCV